MMDDKLIIELFFARKEQAISETKEKYGKKLWSIAYNILFDFYSTEEVENDTYMEAWNRIPPADPGRLLYPFLTKITRHLAIDRFRKENALKRSAEIVELSEELENCLPTAGSPEDTVLAGELMTLINRFLLKYRKEPRDIFVRRYYYMDSIEDIAKRYHLSETAVKSSLYHTRKALKKVLDKEWF